MTTDVSGSVGVVVSGEDWWARLYDEANTDVATAAPVADEIDPDEYDPDELEPDDDPDDAVVGPGRVHRMRTYVRGHHGDVSRRQRLLVYNGSAAGAGWLAGLVPALRGWIEDCGRETGSPAAALVLGAGIVLAAGLLIDRRTRGWWGPLAWACRIPLASAVLALALYAPAA